MPLDKLILVTGATGHQGGAVVDCLLDKGWKVRAFTRGIDEKAVKSLKEKGADTVIGDMNDIGTIEKALEGVYGMFAVTTFFGDGPQFEVQRGKNMAMAAKKAGLKHFIFSSVSSADKKTGIPHFDSKREIELEIAGLGLPFTIFRPVAFMYNYDRPDTISSLNKGIFRGGTGPDKKQQLLSQEDLGAFVALAFEDPGRFLGKSVDLAGDELTMNEIAGVFGKIICKDVRYEQTPLDEIRKFSPEMAVMTEWMDKYGYDADIRTLREIRPEILDLEKWLILHNWHNMCKSGAAA
jgi:uncharacterized protein YbjT (DUF2867 family)